MRTDWSKRTDPVAYQNLDETGQHTPGPDTDAVKFLVDERQVLGFGSEAIGTDAGQAFHLKPPYPCHYYMHGSGRYGLQCLTNLDLLPPTGAVIFAAPLKIKEGSGSPLRVLALVPSSTGMPTARRQKSCRQKPPRRKAASERSAQRSSDERRRHSRCFPARRPHTRRRCCNGRRAVTAAAPCSSAVAQAGALTKHRTSPRALPERWPPRESARATASPSCAPTGRNFSKPISAAPGLVRSRCRSISPREGRSFGTS